ncbi:signal peptidase II [Streptomyces sp. NA04227]|uniref:signal peptidase II n=1 Tax=Streptomyces sp. NA04227 TaxID=2742136 RepID=UPI00158FD48F|nr:signal peptidase II [Streptomyces sp. NA04227]QKW05984.1 signal peptidase II [Streptomyces sp. NA04227]
MAEAERIISTPQSAGAAGAQPATPRPDAPGEHAREAAADRPAESAAPEEGADRSASQSTEASASAEGEGTEQAQASRGRRRIAVLFAVAAVAYILDLVSKMIVVAKLEHRASVEIIGEWLQLEAVRNPGAAFGMGEAFTVIFTLIAASVIVVIVRLARKLYSLPWAIALGLLLGGALGNLTDRIFRAPGVFEGAVVDFIAPKHFAVFNLADSAIVCGGILIVLLSFRGLDPDGTVHKD